MTKKNKVAKSTKAKKVSLFEAKDFLSMQEVTSVDIDTLFKLAEKMIETKFCEIITNNFENL